VFVTPEKVARSDALMRALDGLAQEGRLARVVVDEAHCVSVRVGVWGVVGVLGVVRVWEWSGLGVVVAAHHLPHPVPSID